MTHYINEDSFGPDLPANWESIAAYLNSLIDEQGISDDQDAVNDLWERYCSGDLDDAPEAENPVWYAVMRDRDDDDWGTGSRDYDEAVRMAQALRDDGYSDAYIAVIDDGDDPICTDEITDF